MQVHIKLEHLNDAIVELNQFKDGYQIELGFVFGKRCYWIISNNVDQLLSIGCYAEDDS